MITTIAIYWTHGVCAVLSTLYSLNHSSDTQGTQASGAKVNLLKFAEPIRGAGFGTQAVWL